MAWTYLALARRKTREILLGNDIIITRIHGRSALAFGSGVGPL
jgi:hypothetical protein